MRPIVCTGSYSAQVQAENKSELMGLYSIEEQHG